MHLPCHFLDKRVIIGFVWGYVGCLCFYIRMLCGIECGEGSSLIKKNKNGFCVSVSGRLNICNILEDISYEAGTFPFSINIKKLEHRVLSGMALN